MFDLGQSLNRNVILLCCNIGIRAWDIFPRTVLPLSDQCFFSLLGEGGRSPLEGENCDANKGKGEYLEDTCSLSNTTKQSIH